MTAARWPRGSHKVIVQCCFFKWVSASALNAREKRRPRWGRQGGSGSRRGKAAVVVASFVPCREARPTQRRRGHITHRCEGERLVRLFNIQRVVEEDGRRIEDDDVGRLGTRRIG
jgi:hypothetical protein